MPDLKEQTDNLTKAMELPIKASGVVTMSLMQKAVSGMGAIAGNVGEQLKAVSAPIASTFGVSNTITNNLIRQSENQAEAQDKRDEMKTPLQLEEIVLGGILLVCLQVMEELVDIVVELVAVELRSRGLK